MKNTSTLKRRQDQTRSSLIDQAIGMIAENGMPGLSIRALADQLDYTAGAIYTYFASKDTLVDAARERCFEQMNEYFEQMNEYIEKRMKKLSSAGNMLREAGFSYIRYAGHILPEEKPEELIRELKALAEN